MKLLIVSQYFWPENFKITDLAESLVEKGHTIDVLTGKPNYPQGKFYTGYSFFSPRKEKYKGINIRRLPLIPRGNGSGARLMLNYFSFALTSCFHMLFHHKKYDAILIFATSPITVAFPAILHRKFHKTKTLLWVLDLWPESVSAAGNIRSEKIHKGLTRMVRFIYKHVDKILISSRGFQSSVEEKGVPANKIHYAPNWAEELYENPQIDTTKYESLMPKGFKVMFTGNIGEAQDCEALLETAKLLKEMESNVQLVMIGDGRKKGWFEEEVKKNQLENVHFLGRFPAEEMPNLIAHADVLLVSLKNEPIFALTVPTRIQTSLASGKPIATMLNGEGSVIVEEAKAGLTCKAGDAYSFAKNLHKLSQSSPEELQMMGISGKHYYDAHFNRSKIISKIENYLSN
jgi:glycosyltransferase involved in cell wall biosynthesis